MTTVEDVVGSLDRLMGVKAVWGRSLESIMCFGSRSKTALKDDSHYQTARGVAQRSLEQPFFITIGGGKEVPPELRGRSLELVKSTAVFGDTRAFVKSDDLFERLKQWPIAVVISETYEIEGEPLLKSDLGLSDLGILGLSFDGVVRPEGKLEEFWSAVRGKNVLRKWDIVPPEGFYDPEKLWKCGTLYPALSFAKAEGKAKFAEIRVLERNPAIAKAVKTANRDKHNGCLICEACSFRSDVASMFDAHHRLPLSKGPRISDIGNFSVLCPTCHRWAHQMAPDKLQPLTPDMVRISRKSYEEKVSLSENSN